MYGILLKKSRKNIKDALLTIPNLRFFFIITEKSVKDKEDEFRIDSSQIPPWMETNILYFFECNDENDTSGYKGQFPLKDIESVEMHQLKLDNTGQI